MKRSNKAIFTVLAIVIISLFLVNVFVAAGPENEKADPIQILMENYFVIGQTLSQDGFKGLGESAQKIGEATSQILKEEKQSSPEKKDFFAQVKAIQNAAQKFEAKDLKSAQDSYKGLSQAVDKFVKTYGYSDSAYSFYCPMAKESWLQSTDQIANPFYGSQMLRCGKMTGMVKEGKFTEKTKEMPAGHKH